MTHDSSTFPSTPSSYQVVIDLYVDVSGLSIKVSLRLKKGSFVRYCKVHSSRLSKMPLQRFVRYIAFSRTCLCRQYPNEEQIWQRIVKLPGFAFSVSFFDCACCAILAPVGKKQSNHQRKDTKRDTRHAGNRIEQTSKQEKISPKKCLRGDDHQ